ncbi:hypothetical protein HDV00_002872 [Rhizophlyctis rosea]|nr:hypothetical protein HDV00_002872 [Rhizophlyctis rosea]
MTTNQSNAEADGVDWYTIAPPSSSQHKSSSQPKESPREEGDLSRAAGTSNSSVKQEETSSTTPPAVETRCPICDKLLTDIPEPPDVHANRCIDGGSSNLGGGSAQTLLSTLKVSDYVYRASTPDAKDGPSVPKPIARKPDTKSNDADVPPLPPPLQLLGMDGEPVKVKKSRKPRKKKEDESGVEPKAAKKSAKRAGKDQFTLDFSKVDTSRRKRKRAVADTTLVLPAGEAMQKVEAKAALLLGTGLAREGDVVENDGASLKAKGKRVSITYAEFETDGFDGAMHVEEDLKTLWELSAAPHQENKLFYTDMLAPYQTTEVRQQSPGPAKEPSQSSKSVDAPAPDPPEDHTAESGVMNNATEDVPIDAISAIVARYEEEIKIEKAKHALRLEALEREHAEWLRKKLEAKECEIAIASGAASAPSSKEATNTEIVPETPQLPRTMTLPLEDTSFSRQPSSTPPLDSQSQALFRELVDAVSEDVSAVEDYSYATVPPTPEQLPFDDMGDVGFLEYGDGGMDEDGDEDTQILTQVRYMEPVEEGGGGEEEEEERNICSDLLDGQ